MDNVRVIKTLQGRQLLLYLLVKHAVSIDFLFVHSLYSAGDVSLKVQCFMDLSERASAKQLRCLVKILYTIYLVDAAEVMEVKHLH